MSDKNFYCGVVESRDDPLKLGRVRVRIVGCHTPDKQLLPTIDLPWATLVNADRGIPKEGSIVSVEFWDYPENQMPVVTGVLPSIPQRESIFINQSETSSLLKDILTPNGRPLPQNNDQSSGGVDNNVVVDNNNPPEDIKSAIQKSYKESSSAQTALVNMMTNDSTSSIGGIGAVAQMEQSLGNTTKSKKEEFFENISKYGDIAKAQFATVSSLSQKLGSNIPTDLLNGKLNTTSMLSGINTMLNNLTNGLGGETAAKMVNNLSGISGIGSGTIGNALTNKVVSAVNSALGSNGVSTLTKVSNVTGMLGNTNNLVNNLSNQFKNKLVGSASSLLGAKGTTVVSQATGLLSSIGSGTVTNNLTNQLGTGLLGSAASALGSDGVGAISQAKGLVSSLSGGNNISNTLTNSVSGAASSVLGSTGVTALTHGMNALSTLNIGTMGDFAGMMGTGLSSLTSELSNITSSANSTVSDAITKVSALTTSASLNNLIGGVAIPAGIYEIVGDAGGIEKALTEKANEMVGKGYSAALAVSKDIGGIKTAEDALKKLEQSAKDLKNINVSLTKETYKDVEEGKTPPSSGSNGGANYGGANAINDTPSKQDSEKYSKGSTRELDISWVVNKGDIETILSAAKENGISSKESLSAYLSVIYVLNGGFEQKYEKTNYSESELKKYFPITFSKSDRDTIREYSLGKKEDKEFLTFVYDSANDGITYGNQYPSDGSLYYGYGYIKIVGRSAYTKYAKILNNKDLITNGAKALSDKSLCAKISALEFLERTKTLSPTSHPNFFYQSCSIFGIEFGEAEGFYCKFYGANTQDLMGVGRKIAGAGRSPSGLYIYGGDKSLHGFKDPNKKYPLEDDVCEPSLSKLSRGDIKNSVVSLKESKRRLGVPLPLNMGSWDQPHSSFGAHYPFNKVDESESGHVIEIDDTPNRERLHWYHRSGTFTEIDESGVKVNRIVGDNYTIVDRNGFVSIEGEADVTVGGNVNIYCRSNANIQVEGTANLEIGRNLDIGVAKDVNIRTEGNFNVWANGDFNLQSKINGHILASNNLYQAADKNMYLLSGYVTKDDEGNDIKNAGNLFVESYGNSNYRSLGNTKLYTAKNLSDCVIGDRYNEVKGKINNLWLSDVVTQINGKWDNGVSGETRLSSGGDTSIKSGGNLYEDASEIRMNEGKSKDPSTPISEDNFKKNMPEMMSNESIKALIHGMIPPPLGTPLNVKMSSIEIPMPGDIDGTFESEFETSGKLFEKLMNKVEQISGVVVPDTGKTESVQIYSGNGEKIEKVKGSHFSKDYRLSDHFVLGDFTVNAVFPHSIPPEGQKNLTEDQIITNLKSLSFNVVEKLINYLPNGIDGKGRDWIITSGFRLNKSPSTKNDSQHELGQAVDIQIIQKKNNAYTTYNIMKEICSKVPFDQAILEYSAATGKCWIHISYNNDGNRPSGANKIMTMNAKFKNESASSGHKAGSAYKSGLYLC